MGRESGFVLSAQPCRPSSRGEIRIASDDPAAPPWIQPNSLSTAEDQQAAVRAIHLLKRLAETAAMREVTVKPKGDNITTMDDAEKLESFRQNAGTDFHPTCTCRMGRDATDSVTDARLRVHGLQGLRVVDASAFPSVTSANTNAPVMMLAFHAASLILADATARS